MSSGQSTEPKLSLELVPRPCWGNNVRNEVTPVEWDAIRAMVYYLAEYSCDICEKRTKKLHAHEQWKYDTKTRTQTLIGFQALCERCHEVKHYGRAEIVGRGTHAKDWMKKVNGWTNEEVAEHITESFGEWGIRCEIKNWKLDIHYLKEFMEQF